VTFDELLLYIGVYFIFLLVIQFFIVTLMVEPAFQKYLESQKVGKDFHDKCDLVAVYNLRKEALE